MTQTRPYTPLTNGKEECSIPDLPADLGVRLPLPIEREAARGELAPLDD